MSFFTNENWKLHILKKSLKKSLGLEQRKRDIAKVQKEYSAHWMHPRSLEKPRLALRGNIPILQTHPDFFKSSIEYVTRLIRGLQIKTALEIGSGDGLFTTALKILNPSVEFCGVELTDEGIAASRIVLDRSMDVLTYVTEKNADEIREIFKNTKIPQFEKGNATLLNAADNSFDLVFSHIAIEQMPTIYPAVFNEAYRVSRKYGCFIEEFREAQKGFFQRLTLWKNDYFRASYRVVEKAGFAIVSFDVKAVDKASHSVGMLLCVKK
ncbi:MAG: class I SAM-dependent methyltransferase [Candidatus Sungiibacteriota bacterium]